MKKMAYMLMSLLLVFILTIPSAAAPSGKVIDLPKEYAELYETIPMGAYAGETVTFENLAYTDLGANYQSILISRLMQDKIIVRPEKYDVSSDPKENPNAPRIPLQTIKTAFEGVFGPGSFDQLENTQTFSNKTDNLAYEESSGSYVYTYYSWGGGDPGVSLYAKYIKIESGDGQISLYEKFALYGDYQTKCLYSDAKRLSNQEGTLLWQGSEEDGNTLLMKMDGGALDGYLPLYKHTFKDNGNGGYYWASTEMVEAGTSIPEEALTEETQSTDISTSSTPSQSNPPSASDATDGTDSQTDTGTSDIAPAEKPPLWGIVLGCGVLVVALGVGAIVLIGKRKK